MKSITTIRASQTGWVVCFDDNPKGFYVYVFRADESTRLIEFLCDRVANTKIDDVVLARQAEVKAAREKIG